MSSAVEQPFHHKYICCENDTLSFAWIKKSRMCVWFLQWFGFLCDLKIFENFNWKRDNKDSISNIARWIFHKMLINHWNRNFLNYAFFMVQQKKRTCPAIWRMNCISDAPKSTIFSATLFPLILIFLRNKFPLTENDLFWQPLVEYTSLCGRINCWKCWKHERVGNNEKFHLSFQKNEQLSMENSVS